MSRLGRFLFAREFCGNGVNGEVGEDDDGTDVDVSSVEKPDGEDVATGMSSSTVLTMLSSTCKFCDGKDPIIEFIFSYMGQLDGEPPLGPIFIFSSLKIKL